MNLSDGTRCEHCEEEVLTALGFDYKKDGKVFCCSECAEAYRNK